MPIKCMGDRFPASIATLPVYAENDKLAGIMAAEDIRERKRIERELHERSAILRKVTPALDTFLETGDWRVAGHQLLAGSETVGLIAVAKRPGDIPARKRSPSRPCRS